MNNAGPSAASNASGICHGVLAQTGVGSVTGVSPQTRGVEKYRRLLVLLKETRERAERTEQELREMLHATWAELTDEEKCEVDPTGYGKPTVGITDPE